MTTLTPNCGSSLTMNTVDRAISVWRAEKVHVARPKGKMRSARGLVSDDAPGLFVLVETWHNLASNGPFLEQWRGGKVHCINTGRYIGSAFAGTEAACDYAIGLAKLYDWDAHTGGQIDFGNKLDEYIALTKAAYEANEPLRLAEIQRHIDEEARDE